MIKEVALPLKVEMNPKAVQIPHFCDSLISGVNCKRKPSYITISVYQGNIHLIFYCEKCYNRPES